MLEYGYIEGVIDTVDNVLFCTPKGAVYGQDVAIVTKYMDANPESWHLPANDLIVAALRAAFPCGKQTGH